MNCNYYIAFCAIFPNLHLKWLEAEKKLRELLRLKPIGIPTAVNIKIKIYL